MSVLRWLHFVRARYGRVRHFGTDRSTSANEFGLFESPDPSKPFSPKEHGDLSIPGTLDAELERISVHLGRAGEPYRSSHNLDKTGHHFYPEARNEGFPRRGRKLTQRQREQLAEIMIDTEYHKRRKSIPSIFRWEINYVISKGDFEHELNRFVRMFVFVKELQKKYRLSDEAVQYLIRIVQHRYNKKTGLLTIECEKYPQREDNRREIMRIVDALVEEGRKKFPLSLKHSMRSSYISRKYPKPAPKRKIVDSKEEVDPEVKEFFEMMDSDGDGMLSTEDLKVFFHKSGSKVSDSAIEELMFFAQESSHTFLTLFEFSQALSQACCPDTRSTKSSPGIYKLKQKSFVFDFKEQSDAASTSSDLNGELKRHVS